MLILKDIKKKYNSSKNYVLKNINLVFNETGLVCILGESGSGKSTLLNIIGGIDTPTKGEVFIDRKNINELKQDNTLYNNYIGFIFQSYNLLNYLSVEDNINLLSNNNLDSLMKKLKITKQRQRSVNELSGGEQQRIAIARTIAHTKKIILCDEPTGALDSINSKNIMKILKDLSKKQLVIVVTHSIELANEFGDRIIKIKDGKIEYDSNPILITERKSTYDKVKINYSVKAILTYIANNIILKRRRNIFNIIAQTIGLISLLLVLAISHGFNQSIAYEEKNSLSEYPLYISEYSTNLEDDINEILSEYDNNPNLIYSNDLNHKNTLDETLINYLNHIPNTKYIIKNYLIDDIILSTYNKNIDHELNIIKGNIPNNSHELLLMLDSNNMLDKNLLTAIGLKETTYKIPELINYEFKLDNKLYKIVGIGKFKETSPLYDTSGIYINDASIENLLPFEIYLYPHNYSSKQIIIESLNKYADLEYTDYAKTVKDVSTTIIDSITIILIFFSLITLIVSCLMNYILTNISLTERVKEFGILKVNGITSKMIKVIVYIENYILSITAVLLSIIIVGLISFPTNYLLTNITGLNNIVSFDFNIIKNVFLITIMLTFISIYFPIKRITKMQVIDNLLNN